MIKLRSSCSPFGALYCRCTTQTRCNRMQLVSFFLQDARFAFNRVYSYAWSLAWSLLPNTWLEWVLSRKRNAFCSPSHTPFDRSLRHVIILVRIIQQLVQKLSIIYDPVIIWVESLGIPRALWAHLLFAYSYATHFSRLLHHSLTTSKGLDYFWITFLAYINISCIIHCKHCDTTLLFAN